MLLGILTSHPIQYHAPWFRELAKVVDLEVYFAHRQSAAEQGKAGFGVAFEWDVDLLSGYRHQFLKNVSSRPNVNHFTGCDTPEIAGIISGKQSAETRKRSHLTPDLSPERRGSGDSNFSISASQHLSVSPFDAFIVTGWYLKSYLQAVDACRVAGVPVLVRGDSQLKTPRSLLKRLAMEVRQRWLLRKFDGFLTVGQRNREYLEHYGVPPKKIFFAPHFVDNEWFAARAAQARSPLRLDRGENSPSRGAPPLPSLSPAQSGGEGGRRPGEGEVSSPSAISELPSSIFHLRKSWGADDSDIVALFVGKFIPKKRPMDLVEAARLLLAPGSFPPSPSSERLKIHLLFVGSGELGAQLRAACHVVFDAESPHLQPSTFNLQLPPASFAGFKNQTELPACYAAADVLVLPSDGGETWGLVVNEAMACGLPAIVSDSVGCAPDLVEEGQTGFIYPVGDVEALARRLKQFVELRAAGNDFRGALEKRMRAYSVEAAVRGTVQAAEKLKTEKLKR